MDKAETVNFFCLTSERLCLGESLDGLHGLYVKPGEASILTYPQHCKLALILVEYDSLRLFQLFFRHQTTVANVPRQCLRGAQRRDYFRKGYMFLHFRRVDSDTSHKPRPLERLLGLFDAFLGDVVFPCILRLPTLDYHAVI